MKRIAYTLSLIAATAMAAAPLAAQSSNGPWWDPGRTQTRSGQQNGSVHGRDGNVYGQQNTQADGQWRAYSRDRNGNTIYMRTRYDSNGNLIREYATRNIIGRYSVIDRQVLSNNNGQYGTNGNRGTYDTRGTYDNGNNRNNRNGNDRWDQNNGHDNGNHNGQYKNKNKGRGNNRDRDDDR